MKTEPKSERQELFFDGVGVAAGIAIGPAHVVESGALNVPEYRIKRNQVAGEIARFQAALKSSEKQIDLLRFKTQKLPPAVAEELGFLLDAHKQMLAGSRLVRGVEQQIAENRRNAEAAVQLEISLIVRGFAELQDTYIAARMQDVRDVGTRIIRSLM